MNIEHRTSNIEHPTNLRRTVIRRSVFDVRCPVFVFTAILSAAPQLLAQASTNTLLVLAPPYGEIPPTFWERHGTMLFLGSIAVIALAVLILWKLFQPKSPVIPPPEIVARAALTKLLRQPEDGELLSEISQILRRYIITVFELPSGEMTTAEFCVALAANKKIGTEIAGSISSFFRDCDKRKFSSSPSAAPLNAAASALELVSLVEDATHSPDACATKNERRI